MYHPEALEPISAFLRGIGIPVITEDRLSDSFLPGVTVRAGAIHVAPDALLGSGDLLHEAGHIVAVPRRFWPRLGANLQADIDALLADQPGDPQVARAAQYGEFMAQGWSYAVCRHLDLPPACVFFPGTFHMTGYEGAHPIQQWLERETHYGPLHLADAGMTGFSGVFGLMGDNGLPPYPAMTRWTVD